MAKTNRPSIKPPASPPNMEDVVKGEQEILSHGSSDSSMVDSYPCKPDIFEATYECSDSSMVDSYSSQCGSY